VAAADTRAVVLRTHPYSESTVIARLLTEDFGVRSVIAKGARRPKSRFGALLEPFTDGRIQVRFRDDRDLHTLAGFDVGRSRQGIGRSLRAFAGASLLAEILLRTGTEDPHPDLYAAVITCYDALTDGSEPDAVALGGIWSTLSVLGFGPRTDQCIRCGRDIDPGEETGFDPAGGGVACATCRPRGRRLDGVFRRELDALCGSGGRIEALDDPRLHRELLRAHLIAQVDQDRPFRSLDLFLDSPA